MQLPIIEPVTDAILPEFAQFLHTHLDQSRSTEQWQDGLRVSWNSPRPNYGFVLRDNDQIVGGIGAYYIERPIKGQIEKICNITSWCVLEDYRKQSMRLAMTVVKQPGYHFTDFSPTKVVGATLQFLKFRPLDERQAVVFNIPYSLNSAISILDQADAIEAALEGEALQIYRDHADFPWLKHVLVGKSGAWCHIIYKRTVFKHFPTATILYSSDKALFSSYLNRFSGYLLMRGYLTTLIECRFLDKLPLLSVVRSGFNAKLYLSESLTDDDIDYLYSETMALDL